jgi:DNA-directed RNA polymerase subunit N (RpoN/RPB10)
MKINCLSCGHKVELDDAYDDYAGQVKCFACGAILEIKTAEGKLKSAVEVAWGLARPAQKEP